ncbi:MAG: hypothetical protein CMP63_06955 [Flavobacteriales bacterium]|nr:hypothetical protein [Flavobacteriales bacterium]|tara:strand:+ start:406 stop:1323 length:918 start_codon:yes stop_codon:yes gene_type:complete
MSLCLHSYAESRFVFSIHNFSPVLANANSAAGVEDTENKEINYENIPRFKRSRVFCVLLLISFLVNIPFFLKWAKKQKGSDEVLLYNVEGNFTYLTVLLWIERIEEFNGKILHKERSEIEKFHNVAKKGNKSIRIFKRKIHDILFIKAFGEKMVRTAFKRMALYSKITYLMDIAVYLSIINSAICLLSINYGWIASIIIGLFVGNIVAAPVWLICHLIFNHLLKSSARKQIKEGDGIGLRIIMAQFYGGFAGLLWKDLYYIQGRSSWTFGGGSSKGGFLKNVPTSSYSSAYTREEEKEELDFDND